MTATNLRFLGFGRFSENIILGHHALEKNYETNLRTEANNLIGKLRLLNLSPDERQKCNTQNGSWFCRVDSNGIVYLALCSATYPERHAYAFIQETQEELEKIPEYQDASADVLSKHAKRFLPSLMKKYDDLASLDQVYAAQQKADGVKDVMGENIKNIMTNMQSIESLETKSSSMQEQARMFSTDSTQLARVMKRRLWKMRIIVFILILAVVLYIVIPLVSKND